MSGQLQDLIARLEKASGPDHGIDGRIAMDVLGWTYEKRKPHDRKSYWRKPGDDWYLRQEYGPPRFTRSIDAALTLVPEGWELDELLRHVEHGNDHQIGEQDYGIVIRRLDDVGYSTSDDAIGAHDTLAIALCIAALKARASLSGKGEAS